MQETNTPQPGIRASMEAQGYRFPETPAPSAATYEKMASELDNDYLKSVGYRSAERANWKREHPRHQLSLGRKAILGIATGAAVLTPQGREAVHEVGDTIGATASAAADRLDTYFNGPDEEQKGEQDIPENPNDMVVKITPEQTAK
jgi:hypothetical protein